MKTRLPHSVDLTNFTQKRPKSTQRRAFTSVELMVVVAVLAVLLLLWSHNMSRPRRYHGYARISCINNLKQIGTAYRIWANDNGGLYPASTPLTNGGWEELLTGNNAGALCWTNYTIMQNEMGQSAKVVVCPSDEREANTNFNGASTAPPANGTFNNANCSYFVGIGLEPNDADPQGLLAGDRNIGPGTVSKNDYGYSPANGQGNDVFVTNPVCWSLKMHSAKNTVGAGNILLADGSAQQVTSTGLRQNWIKPLLAASATNHVPVRLIFP